ncbi:MAG: T9SS type A sorting domain-containing protein [Flavobacteriales bacterium]|nr:T9SS type A sorting domain-containing protein [Flavobacteriales bacterium]
MRYCCALLFLFVQDISMYGQSPNLVWYVDTTVCYTAGGEAFSQRATLHNFSRTTIGSTFWSNEYPGGPFAPNYARFDIYDQLHQHSQRKYFKVDSLWVMHLESVEKYGYISGRLKVSIRYSEAGKTPVYVDSSVFDNRGRLLRREQFQFANGWKRLNSDTFAYAGNYLIFEGITGSHNTLTEYNKYVYFGDSSRYCKLYFQRGTGSNYFLLRLDSVVTYKIGKSLYTAINSFEVDTDTLPAVRDTLMERANEFLLEKRSYYYYQNKFLPRGIWIAQKNAHGNFTKNENYIFQQGKWKLYQGQYWKYVNAYDTLEYKQIVGEDTLWKQTFYNENQIPLADSTFRFDWHKKRILQYYCSHRADFVLSNYEVEDKDEVITVYPNPTSGSISVDMTQEGIRAGYLRICTMQGVCLVEQPMEGAYGCRLDLRAWAPGMYVLQYHSANRIYTRKIIKK